MDHNFVSGQYIIAINIKCTREIVKSKCIVLSHMNLICEKKKTTLKWVEFEWGISWPDLTWPRVSYKSTHLFSLGTSWVGLGWVIGSDSNFAKSN